MCLFAIAGVTLAALERINVVAGVAKVGLVLGFSCLEKHHVFVLTPLQPDLPEILQVPCRILPLEGPGLLGCLTCQSR